MTKTREQYAKFIQHCYDGYVVSFGEIEVEIKVLSNRFHSVLHNCQITIEADTP